MSVFLKEGEIADSLSQTTLVDFSLVPSYFWPRNTTPLVRSLIDLIRTEFCLETIVSSSKCPAFLFCLLLLVCLQWKVICPIFFQFLSFPEAFFCLLVCLLTRYGLKSLPPSFIIQLPPRYI